MIENMEFCLPAEVHLRYNRKKLWTVILHYVHFGEYTPWLKSDKVASWI